MLMLSALEEPDFKRAYFSFCEIAYYWQIERSFAATIHITMWRCKSVLYCWASLKNCGQFWFQICNTTSSPFVSAVEKLFHNQCPQHIIDFKWVNRVLRNLQWLMLQKCFTTNSYKHDTSYQHELLLSNC